MKMICCCWLTDQWSYDYIIRWWWYRVNAKYGRLVLIRYWFVFVLSLSSRSTSLTLIWSLASQLKRCVVMRSSVMWWMGWRCISQSVLAVLSSFLWWGLFYCIYVFGIVIVFCHNELLFGVWFLFILNVINVTVACAFKRVTKRKFCLWFELLIGYQFLMLSHFVVGIIKIFQVFCEFWVKIIKPTCTTNYAGNMYVNPL